MRALGGDCCWVWLGLAAWSGLGLWLLVAPVAGAITLWRGFRQGLRGGDQNYIGQGVTAAACAAAVSSAPGRARPPSCRPAGGASGWVKQLSAGIERDGRGLTPGPCTSASAAWRALTIAVQPAGTAEAEQAALTIAQRLAEYGVEA